MSLSLPGPAFGSSESVIRKTLLDAVFGALIQSMRLTVILQKRHVPVTHNPVTASEYISDRNTVANEWRKFSPEIAGVLPGR